MVNLLDLVEDGIQKKAKISQITNILKYLSVGSYIGWRDGERNEAFLIRVWKLLPSRRVLKP